MPNHVLAFLVAMVVAVAVTPAVIFFAKKTGALDAPDARKVHKKPVPRIGGVGIYIAFMAAMLSFMVYGELSDEVLTEESAREGQAPWADRLCLRARRFRCAH